VQPSLVLRDVPKQPNGWLELRLARKDTAIAEDWMAFLNRSCGQI
jgi:hypothetical protein